MQSVEATQASGVEPGWDCKAAAVTASGPSAAVGIKRIVGDETEISLVAKPSAIGRTTPGTTPRS